MDKKRVLLIRDYWQEVIVRETTEYYLTEEKYKELIRLHEQKDIVIRKLTYDELQSLEDILEEQNTGLITKEIIDENDMCDIEEINTQLKLDE
jgi:hypothetical protein